MLQLLQLLKLLAMNMDKFAAVISFLTTNQNAIGLLASALSYLLAKQYAPALEIISQLLAAYFGTATLVSVGRDAAIAKEQAHLAQVRTAEIQATQAANTEAIMQAAAPLRPMSQPQGFSHEPFKVARPEDKDPPSNPF